MKISIVGASGFVGMAIVRAVRGAGFQAIPVSAPRISSSARSAKSVIEELSNERFTSTISALASELSGSVAVINAAGLAMPSSAMTDGLVGANAVLPGLIAAASVTASTPRFVHLSSAAVHGYAEALDVRDEVSPATPYGMTKRWGELAAKTQEGDQNSVVIYRPTSVFGDQRELTGAVRRLARSRFSSVAAPGNDPTPQAAVDNVAELAVRLALDPQPPRSPLLHPWEGWTTSGFLKTMGDGREPHQIPRPIARLVVRCARLGGRIHPKIMANARRLEVLWFGQRITVTGLEGW